MHRGNFALDHKKLRQLRKELGLSQEEFAAKLGLSQNTISQWENQLRSPDLESIETVAHLLGVPLQTLIASPNRRLAQLADLDLRQKKQDPRRSADYYFDETARCALPRKRLCQSFRAQLEKDTQLGEVRPELCEDLLFLYENEVSDHYEINLDDSYIDLNGLPDALRRSLLHTFHDKLSTYLKEIEARWTEISAGRDYRQSLETVLAEKRADKTGEQN